MGGLAHVRVAVLDERLDARDERLVPDVLERVQHTDHDLRVAVVEGVEQSPDRTERTGVAERFGRDREAYAEAKTVFVEAVLDKVRR